MSASLPPLPSVRAKELESRASAVSQPAAGSSSGDAEKLTGTHAAETSRPAKEQGALDSNKTLSGASPIAPYQSDAGRSEQLAAMHHKEEQAFGGMPPLEASEECNAIHQYISTTSAFLNSFVADANASHEGIDRKLSVLEKQMALLESTISGMPDLFPDED
ncbi:hypothetical protein ACHAXT_007385 [Thalassiosira profunda]